MSDFFIADDLSGALDAAAAFHHAGRRVIVAVSPDAWAAATPGQVIGITTETRNAAPEIAAAAVRQAVARGRASGGRLLYKKIDSTLRGPVAAELAALEAAMPGTRILFVPANPRVGRTVRNGLLLVNGTPVAETDFARDPLSPVTESAIARLLGAALTPQVVLADASSEEDLAAAVARMNAGGVDWVAVGSGALARPVAASQPGVTLPAEPAAPEIPAGPVLFVCGSAHGLNREQSSRLAREHGVPVHEVRPADGGPAIQAAISSVRARGAAALLLETPRTDSMVALAAIAAAATRVITEGGVRRVFVTGGETAFALGGLLGIAALRFLREVEPGLSISRGEAALGAMLLAVKPGGFGDAQTWIRAWTELRRARAAG